MEISPVEGEEENINAAAVAFTTPPPPDGQLRGEINVSPPPKTEKPPRYHHDVGNDATAEKKIWISLRAATALLFAVKPAGLLLWHGANEDVGY